MDSKEGIEKVVPVDAWASTHYGGKSSPYDKTRTYAVRHTDVQLLDPEQDEPNPPLNCEFNTGGVYDEGYYMAIIAMADEVDQWGRRFNCGKEGHRWAKCTKLLKDSLKWAKEGANHKKQSLNWDGEPGPREPSPPRWVWPRPKTNKPMINSLRILE